MHVQPTHSRFRSSYHLLITGYKNKLPGQLLKHVEAKRSTRIVFSVKTDFPTNFQINLDRYRYDHPS